MNLQQLRFVREAVRKKFNLTEAAKALYTSQPGISKGIIELEEELGVQLFIRHGKRIQGLTETGEIILPSIERALQEIESLKKIGNDYAGQEQGKLTIAATHTQARYSLPEAIALFKQQFPKINLSILQGNPSQVADMVMHGQADIGIATEALADYKGLVTLPFYEWQHVAVFHKQHPLSQVKQLSVELLSQYPIITYDRIFAGRKKIDVAFDKAHITPEIILEAIDSDVIKTYAELGLGVGLMAEIAFDAKRDKHLSILPAGHLFGKNIARIGLKQGGYLRSYLYTMIQLLAPNLQKTDIEKALRLEK